MALFDFGKMAMLAEESCLESWTRQHAGVVAEQRGQARQANVFVPPRH
jgi:hypothetical protein